MGRDSSSAMERADCQPDKDEKVVLDTLSKNVQEKGSTSSSSDKMDQDKAKRASILLQHSSKDILVSDDKIKKHKNNKKSNKSSNDNGAKKSSPGDHDKVHTHFGVLRATPLSMFFNNKVGSSFASNHHQAENALLNHQSLQGLQSVGVAISNGAAAKQLPVVNRKVRNSGSLLIMLTYLGFLSYIIWDGLMIKEADVNMVVHGHDSYGNICGRNNRPIRFVEKSGKNYTDKPYTKYTLINAHFERYSIDQSRVKNGELLYVKSSLLSNPETENDDEDNVSFDDNHGTAMRLDGGLGGSGKGNKTTRRQLRAAAAEEAIVKTTQETASLFDSTLASSSSLSAKAPLNAQDVLRLLSQQQQRQPQHQASDSSDAEVIAKRVRRSTQSLFESDAVRRNSTLLNSLKAKLMYQYPPLYGYVPMPTTTTTTTNKTRATTATNRTAATTTNLAPSSLNRSTADGFARSGILRPTFKAVTALNRTPNDQLSPMSSVAFDTFSPPRSTAPRPSHQTITTTTTPVIPNTALMRPVVTFDDVYNNDTDGSFDHMLIVPMVSDSTMRRQPPPTSLDAVTHSEASSQLLYLTECVASCPKDHVELVFFRCMPNNWRFSLFPNAINVTQTFIDDILTDVSHCYKELIYTFSLALVLSLGLLILLRFLASAMIWSCILMLTTLFVSMAIYSWLNYYYLIIDLNNINPHETAFADKLATSDKWLIGSIFLTFVAFATIGVVIFMRKRILLVTRLFRESGKAIADMPLLIMQPLLTFAVLIAITIAWLVGLICLQSIKTPSVDINTGLVVFKAETLYKIMKWYHMFAFLWVSHFAIACQHYVIGASVSKWYFSENRYNLTSPIGTSVSELILYYLGSVALGSFLVAIFKIIRIIIRQIQYLVQKNCMSPVNGSRSNSLSSVHANISSAGCCGSFGYVWRLFLWFFDNIVMIIHRDAYVEIAIHGYSFLDGARRAFTVLATNPLKLLAMKSVSNILLGVAKICVVFGTVSVAVILLEDKSNQLNYAWSPVVISAIYAYIVAHWFLSVYEMVIDALFICYCEDYELSKSREVANSLQSANSNLISQILNNSVAY